jgi:hypothetical protein
MIKTIQTIRAITFLLTIGALNSCSTLLPTSEKDFTTYVNYGKYDIAVFSSAGARNGIRTEHGKKHLYYAYGMLAANEMFPKSALRTKYNDKPIYAVDNEEHSQCVFSEGFNPQQTLVWTQQIISKEFYFCSALNGYSPSMVILAGLLLNEPTEASRYGQPLHWLVEAAKRRNSLAIEILAAGDIEPPQPVIDEETAKLEIEYSARIFKLFEEHDPDIASENWNTLTSAIEERSQGTKKLFQLAGAVITANAVLEYGGKVSDSSKILESFTNSSQEADINYKQQSNISPILSVGLKQEPVTAEQNGYLNQPNNGIGSSESCECKCINGVVKAVCSNTLSVAPVCSPRVCPVPQPTTKPIQQPYVAPIGTMTCTLKQVYNDSTSMYEWKQICN